MDEELNDSDPSTLVMGPEPSAQPQQQQMPPTWTGADQLTFDKMASGARGVKNDLINGLIFPEDAAPILNGYDRQLGPMAQQKAAAAQYASQQAQQAAMQQRAMGTAATQEDAAHDAMNFHRKVASLTNPTTGETAHFYQPEPGKWDQVDWPQAESRRPMDTGPTGTESAGEAKGSSVPPPAPSTSPWLDRERLRAERDAAVGTDRAGAAQTAFEAADAEARKTSPLSPESPWTKRNRLQDEVAAAEQKYGAGSPEHRGASQAFADAHNAAQKASPLGQGQDGVQPSGPLYRGEVGDKQFNPTSAQKKVAAAAASGGKVDRETFNQAQADKDAQENGSHRAPTMLTAQVRNKIMADAIQSHGAQPGQAVSPAIHASIMRTYNQNLKAYEGQERMNHQEEMTARRFQEVAKNDRAKEDARATATDKKAEAKSQSDTLGHDHDSFLKTAESQWIAANPGADGKHQAIPDDVHNQLSEKAWDRAVQKHADLHGTPTDKSPPKVREVWDRLHPNVSKPGGYTGDAQPAAPAAQPQAGTPAPAQAAPAAPITTKEGWTEGQIADAMKAKVASDPQAAKEAKWDMANQKAATAQAALPSTASDEQKFLANRPAMTAEQLANLHDQYVAAKHYDFTTGKTDLDAIKEVNDRLKRTNQVPHVPLEQAKAQAAHAHGITPQMIERMNEQNKRDRQDHLAHPNLTWDQRFSRWMTRIQRSE